MHDMRLQARAEKARKRQASAVSATRARERSAVAMRQRIEQIKAAHCLWLAHLFPRGMSIRQGLQSLNFSVGPGQAGERVALKRARVFYHPDSARRRNVSLEEQVKCEEIFKALGSLRR
jgi:hypothetical protein